MAIYGSLVNSDAGGALGFKNLLINGNFDVWQRATTYTASNIGSYQTADRWYMTSNGGVNVTYSQQALGFDQNGKSNSMRVQRASGSSGRFYLTQLMETTVLNRCRGKSVTLSYWAKRGSDLGATDVVVRVGTQTSETTRDDAKVQYLDSTPSLSTSWQKFSHTLTLTSTSDSASGFLVEFIAERAGGTNVWYEVAQVQLEIGSVATPFEFRPFGVEFSLCQRYYELSTPYGTFPSNGADSTSLSATSFCLGAFVPWGSTNASRPVIRFAVQKRATPTIGQWGNNSGLLLYLGSGGGGLSSDNTLTSNVNMGVNAIDATMLCLNNQATGDTIFGVGGAWSASAEL